MNDLSNNSQEKIHDLAQKLSVLETTTRLLETETPKRYKVINKIKNIYANDNPYSVENLCSILNVSKSGYYRWLKINKEKES